jgi:hypothetical protein
LQLGMGIAQRTKGLVEGLLGSCDSQ